MAACAAFWKLAFKGIPEIISLKEKENIFKKIPQYQQIKKNIYQKISPKIHMNFAFLNTSDGTIVKVNSENTPLVQYQRDPKYKKLYEEAHIEVISTILYAIQHE